MSQWPYRWDLLSRYRLIEIVALWEGRLTTNHLMNSFGIGRQQASKDINAYLADIGPGNLEYDRHLKGYRLASDGLPGNVWSISNTCASNRALRKMAADLHLPVHDAMFPIQLARQAIEFWTEPGQLVVDLMSGTNTLGFAAELLGRKWISGEQNAQSLLMGGLRWQTSGRTVDINPHLIKACA